MDLNLFVYDLIVVVEDISGDFYTWKAVTKLFLGSSLTEIFV